MRQYGFIQALTMGFYSKKFYRDVAANWGKMAMLYLLFIFALNTIVIAIVLQTGSNRMLDLEVPMIKSQMPEITIVDGALRTPENRPYMIRDTGSNKLIGIIDTSGTYNSLDGAGAKFLLTRTELLYRQDKNHLTRVYDLPSSLEKGKMNKIFDMAEKGTNWVTMYQIISVFLNFLGFVLLSFVYSIPGYIVNLLLRAQLSYSKVLALTLVCFGPMLIINSVIHAASLFSGSSLNYLNSAWPFFYFILPFIYIIYGILANKHP